MPRPIGEKEGAGDGVVIAMPIDSSDNEFEYDGEADLQERPMCAICLELFKAGDEVSSSHDKKCAHVFHRECVLEWLLKHESCPFCRRKFIHQGSCHIVGCSHTLTI